MKLEIKLVRHEWVSLPVVRKVDLENIHSTQVKGEFCRLTTVCLWPRLTLYNVKATLTRPMPAYCKTKTPQKVGLKGKPKE